MVSLIVPIKDDAKYIGRCLQSLVDQNYPTNLLEIIVVDGRSRDGSRKIVKRFAGRDRRIRLLENPRIITAAGANIGLRAACGTLLGIVGAHSALDPDYLPVIVKLLEDRPDLSCAGGSMKTIGSGFVGRAIAAVLGSPFGVGDSKFRTSEKEQLVDTLAFGLYSRAAVEGIGFFDERLVRNEDNDFHARLRRAGGKLLLTPRVHSYYFSPDTVLGFSRQAFNNGRWNIRLIRLVGARLSGRHLVPLLFLLALTAFVVLSLAGRSQPLIILASVYFLASSIASIAIGLKGGWRFASILPMLFLLLHLSYGLGSAAGLVEIFAGSGAWRPETAEPGSIKKPATQKEKIQ